MTRGAPLRLLERGLLLRLLCLVIGALLLLVSKIAAYVVLCIGAVLLVLAPFTAAGRGADRQFHPDHKVEGRTFLVDLFQGVRHGRPGQEPRQTEPPGRYRS